MNALTYASNPQAAAAPLRDPFAALLARVARLAIELSGRGLASLGAFAQAQASAAAYSAALNFVVTQDAPEGAADFDEPSMAELLARLAALGEDIRRVRQRHGMDGRDPSNRDGRESPGDADRQ
jgi:hypothetical protein